MASIGSWWVRGYSKEPDEEVLQGFYANYLRSEGRPLGGKLYVTSQRLLFCPHLIDSLMGGSRSVVSLSEIERAERFNPAEADDVDDNVVGGGTQERLRVELVDGETSYFIVNDLDDLDVTITEAIAAR